MYSVCIQDKKVSFSKFMYSDISFSKRKLHDSVLRSRFGVFQGPFWHFYRLFDLAKFHSPGGALFGPFQACLRSVSFLPGLLSIPMGRAQEYFT